ncbi:MAG: NifU family protein [Cyclobacteriaceae bacterium]|nr:NifU family protein [Cyclobacteriaceae bacterium]
MSGTIDISPSLNERITTALDTIRPYLEADGGDMKIIELTNDMVLRIELLGACSSCKMSTMTLKAGVEQAVLKAVPEIKSVEAITHMEE